MAFYDLFTVRMLVLYQNKQKTREEANMPAKTKILAVSRDSALISFLQQELNGSIYEIINTQHTGGHIRDVLDTEKPEFIIVDIMMPTLDGIGTCLQIRQWTQQPIIMLSTWDTGDGTVRGLNLGSDTYLTEPFGGDVLKKRIKESLNR
jgi:two-component system alkaline phosphatase synthesis response regulator PhoP